RPRGQFRQAACCRRREHRLATLRAHEPIVLGLPRGGVVVAAEIATALAAPLDVLLVGKVGLPSQPELALGAVGEGSVVVTNRAIIRDAKISQELLRRTIDGQQAVLAQRAASYRRTRPALSIANRIVVLVDDGIATGATMRAAIRVLRARRVARIVVAVPVALADLADAISRLVDHFVCLRTPRRFTEVSTWYADVAEVTDTEVIALLREAQQDREVRA